MNISLPDAMRAYVDEQVLARGYGSSSEFMRDLIRRDQEREALRGLLLEGARAQGETLAEDAFFDALRARAEAARRG